MQMEYVFSSGHVYTQVDDIDYQQSLAGLPTHFRLWQPDPKHFGHYQVMIAEGETPSSLPNKPLLLSKHITVQIKHARDYWYSLSDRAKKRKQFLLEQGTTLGFSVHRIPYSLVEIESQLYLMSGPILGKGSYKEVQRAYPIYRGDNLVFGPAKALSISHIQDHAELAAKMALYQTAKRCMTMLYGWMSDFLVRKLPATKAQPKTIYSVQPLMPGITVENYDCRDVCYFSADMQMVMRVDMAIAFVEAVIKAHSLGLYLNDIKPGNMNYHPFLKIMYLLDFDHADFVPKAMTGLIGAPEFVSPNIQTKISFTYNRGSDLYAVGMVLFYLFLAEMPDEALTMLKASSRTMHERLNKGSLNLDKINQMQWLLKQKPDECNLGMKYHIENEKQRNEFIRMISALKNFTSGTKDEEKASREALQRALLQLRTLRSTVPRDPGLDYRPEKYPATIAIRSRPARIFFDLFAHDRYGEKYGVLKFIGLVPRHPACQGIFNRVFFHFHNLLFALKLAHNIAILITIYPLQVVYECGWQNHDVFLNIASVISGVLFALLFPLICPRRSIEKAANIEPVLGLLCLTYRFVMYAAIVYLTSPCIISIATAVVGAQMLGTMAGMLAWFGPAAKTVAALSPLLAIGALKMFHHLLLGRTVKPMAPSTKTLKGIWQQSPKVYREDLPDPNYPVRLHFS